MKEKEMYCLFTPEGKPNLNFIKPSVDSVKMNWLAANGNDGKWEHWDKYGFTIKKVKVEITEI